MADDAVIIGRVAVKVTPDTSDFREDVRAKLEKEERRLKVTVPVKLDMAGTKKQLLADIREINRDIKGRDAYKVKLGAKLVATRVKTDLREIRKQYQAAAKVGDSVKLDAQLVADNVKLQLDQDSLDHVEKALKHWRDKRDPMKINVKLELAELSTKITSARLTFLARRRDVELVPRLNEAAAAKVSTALAALSGARVIGNYLDDLWQAFKNLDKSVPLLGTIALAVANIGSLALTSTSNLFALASSLAQIGPLALTLPGVVGGMAIGVGATIAVLKDFNKILPEVKGKLAALQNRMSAKFWKVAKGPFREFINQILPQFSKGIEKASSSLGGFFAGLANSLKGELDGALAGMFDDLALSIDTAKKMTQPFASIIKTLGSVGASYLPKLSQWFVDISKNFDKWLSAANSSGALQDWIDNALVQLQDLGKAIKNIGGILAGIGKAASSAGGSSIGMLADTLERVHKVIDSPAFQEGMAQIFNAAHAAMEKLADKAGPAVLDFFQGLDGILSKLLTISGDTLGTLIGGIADALGRPEFQGGLLTFFEGIQKAVEGLAPHLPDVAKGLGAMGQMIGTLLENLGPNFGAVIGQVADTITRLEPVLTPLISQLGEGLGKAITDALPVIEKIVTKMSEWLAPLAGNEDLVAGLVTAFLGFKLATPVITGVGKAVSGISKGIGTAKDVANTLGRVRDGFKNSQAAASAFSGKAGSFGGALKTAVTKLGEFGKATIDAGKKAATFAAEQVVNGAKAAGAWIASCARMIGSMIVTAATFVAQGIKMALQMAITVARVVAGWVVMAAQSLIQAARMAASWIIAMGPIGWVIAAVVALAILIIANWDKIKAWTVKIWNAVVDWIVKAWDNIKKWVSEKAQAVVDWVRTKWDQMVDLIRVGMDKAKTWITDGWDKIKTGVSKGIDKVVEFVRSLPGKMLDALGNLGGLLKNAGAQIIGGLKKGLEDRWRDVKQWFKDKTAEIPNLKGPAPVDAKLLVNAGQLIIDGLLNGMESRYDAVRKSLRGLTRDIGSTVFTPPSVSALSMTNGALNDAMNTSGAGNKWEITVPMMPTDSTPEDVADAILFSQKRVAYGSAYAQ